MNERFWSKVDKSDDCWLWTAYTESGYGRFWLGGGKRVMAHRYSYEQLVGPIPDGYDLDHKTTCPRTCVNPAHLRLATRKQNMENLRGARSDNKLGVRGVHKCKYRYRAVVGHNGKLHHVGYFDTVEEASAAAEAKRIELFTHNDRDRV